MTMISYNPPRVTDHGSLIDLTADFDVHFVGSVAKVVTLAAVSPPTGGIVPGGGEPPAAGPSGPPAGPAGAVLESAGLPAGGGPGAPTDVLGDTREVADGPGGPADAGGVAGTGTGGGGSGGGGGGGSGGGGGGGSLPFTGYYATLSAAAGATLTTAGVALRAKLRRKS